MPQSPVGPLVIESDGTSVIRVDVLKKRTKDTPDAVTKNCTKELERYFSGKTTSFSAPMEARGTAFQKSVWKEMKKIPHGKTLTYAQIAKRIGKPKAVRAVGTACGKNPLLILIPCHRVVGSNGGLGGYSAGIAKKVWLLAHEAKSVT